MGGRLGAGCCVCDSSKRCVQHSVAAPPQAATPVKPNTGHSERFGGRSEGREKGMGRRECRAGAGLGPGLGPRMDRGNQWEDGVLGEQGADARIRVKKGRTVLGRVAACVELRVPV